MPWISDTGHPPLPPPPPPPPFTPLPTGRLVPASEVFSSLPPPQIITTYDKTSSSFPSHAYVLGSFPPFSFFARLGLPRRSPPQPNPLVPFFFFHWRSRNPSSDAETKLTTRSSRCPSFDFAHSPFGCRPARPFSMISEASFSFNRSFEVGVLLSGLLRRENKEPDGQSLDVPHPSWMLDSLRYYDFARTGFSS